MYQKLIVLLIAIFALYVLFYEPKEKPKSIKTTVTKNIIKNKAVAVKNKAIDFKNSDLVKKSLSKTKSFFSKLKKQHNAYKETKKRRLQLEKDLK